MKKITFEALATMICSLPISGELVFYGAEDGDSYGATKQSFFEAEVVILNYFGGGNPFIMDLEWSDAHEKVRDILHGLKTYAHNTGFSEIYVNEEELE